MKKRILALLISVLFLTCMAACTSPAEPQTTTPSASMENDNESNVKPIKAIMLLSGLANDGGWNQCGYMASEYLNENIENVEADYIENVTLTTLEATLRDYADRGYNLLVGFSFDVGEIMFEVAKDYPEANFVWAQGNLSGDNFVSFTAPLEQNAFLIGALSAAMSETGKIGFVGGMDTPTLVNVLNGYTAGAKYMNPDTEVLYSFLGTWSDAEKSKLTCFTMFEKGVDVMMGRGDGVLRGALQACKERGVYFTGDASDQNQLAPDIIISSAIWNVGRNLEVIIEDIRADQFGNKIYHLGMDEGVVDIADFHGLVPDEIAEQIYEIRDKIIFGEIVVEENFTLIDQQ